MSEVVTREVKVLCSRNPPRRVTGDELDTIRHRSQVYLVGGEGTWVLPLSTSGAGNRSQIVLRDTIVDTAATKD